MFLHLDKNLKCKLEEQVLIFLSAIYLTAIKITAVADNTALFLNAINCFVAFLQEAKQDFVLK